MPEWKECIEKIFLTKPNQNGVLPQDASYLTLREVDLSKYKQQKHVGGIYKDYNQEQINKIQVSKQADVMVLFYLLEEQFSEAVKKASWSYYEPRTLHDSSLSLSTHSVLACDIGDVELGYQMFRKACGIDLSNENPHSSDAGIHAASCGGLWQCVVYGFGGVRMLGGKLRISPKLPEAWSALRYTILWQGQKLSDLLYHISLIVMEIEGYTIVLLQTHHRQKQRRVIRLLKAKALGVVLQRLMPPPR